MQLYDQVSAEISRVLTARYSSSFSASSLLFNSDIRHHIYSIYGLVRIADEIVDTYQGNDKLTQLDGLESEAYLAIKRGYSANPIVHSYANTARQYGIDRSLIAPFFSSMRVDIDPPASFTPEQYKHYIVGSAEVVGLMCLRVFVRGDETTYRALEPGASHLGAAYQKVNFLRDLADDHQRLGRVYFPGVDYLSFDDEAKRLIEQDIDQDFTAALPAIKRLPGSTRRAVLASYNLYHRLHGKLKRSSADTIKTQRIRVPGAEKVWLIARALFGSAV